ncbi:ATP-binding protein [Kaistia geumhonensis]|uniref:histidine kinase n=1 Tax=Kaistia geumhonensis TaxID=410839 RepID=A0ABU0M6D8_9HYPH|nr:ATP-binding protein [Kaistia geumhonensis]MCX5478252.1 ATP-binding protein [Kaistia geumhonensis]MDQ0516531.1 two-component system sensor histidine kinase RegB [Kaistia geumhonensis]
MAEPSATTLLAGTAETTNRKNLLLLIQLRALAVLGQVVTILYAAFVLGITLPLVQLFVVLGALAGLNLLALLRYRITTGITSAELMMQLLLDVAALTMQLYLTGGATNPFISLYLLQVILAAVLLDRLAVWIVVAVATGCFILLSDTYRELVVPGGHGSAEGHGDRIFALHIQGMLISFVLAAILVVVFVGRIQRNLRARDAYVAELRQRFAEEDHVVRMGLLASGAAHELGTPLATLSVIMGDWQQMPAIASDPALSGELAEMQAELDRCKAIVSGILLSSGDMRGEGTVRTTLGRFLDETVAEWRLSRPVGRLDYQAKIEPDIPIVSDAAMKQVLANVLDNAREASPDFVGVTARRIGGDVVIGIRDAGPGFPEERLKSFGKPYNSSKNRPGSGLGLFLVVNVVRKLGGTVVAVNNPEGGATVRLTLPLRALALKDEDGSGA